MRGLLLSGIICLIIKYNEMVIDTNIIKISSWNANGLG